MFYSKSTNWFYDASINASMPSDVCEITSEEHAALMAAQAAGKVITSTQNGQPIAQNRPPVATVVPAVVTMRQARLALLAAGKLAGVAAVIESMPSPQKEAARIEWEYAATVDRNSPLMAHLALALGLGAVSLDNLFMGASTL